MTIQITGMCPLIQVHDFEEALHFYCEILGFEIAMSDNEGRPHDWCLLKWGEAELMLNTIYEPGHAPPHRDQARANHHDDTALFFGCENIEETYEILKAKGIALDPPIVTGYGMQQLYLHDPDGYNLCFQKNAS